MRMIYSIRPDGAVAVDDLIFVKGAPTTAGSRILEGFEPLFSAEVVERVEKAGYPVAGITAVGEFGLDLLGEFSYNGPMLEDTHLVGAAASLVANGTVEGALNVDLNGTPRRAAAVSGVVFIKPTYGTVSRYGIIPCACSGEQVGVTARDTATAAKLLSAISGHDVKDGTSLPTEHYDYSDAGEVRGLRICVIRDLLDAASDEMRAKVEQASETLKEQGAAVETVSFPLAEQAATAWQILMSAETCNNISRYDGVKFGYRAASYSNIDELYTNSRTEGMNLLSKALILYGSDVLSRGRYLECYDRSLRVRRIVAEETAKLLKDYDLILTPPCSRLDYEEYPIAEAFDRVTEEGIFSAIPNLIGIPAIVVNGVQLLAACLQENTLLRAARAVKEGAAK